MKTRLSLIIAFFILNITALAQTRHPLEHRIVTVRVTSQDWNEYRPWQKQNPRARTFIGSVISGNRILMLADDISNATLIQVEKFDRPPRVPARVIHCDQQVGLAIITVDQPGFFDDLVPIEIAENTVGKDYFCASWSSSQLTLAACRWLKSTVYNSSVPYFNYLGIRFRTDLSGGGWGEPVFSGEKMIGLGISQSEDRMNVLSVETINSYLNALQMKEYPGFGWLGINYQVNKGPAQAAFFGQKGPPTGVLVRSTFPGSSTDGLIKPKDILLSLDGHKIDSLGNYPHPRYGLIDIGLIASDGHYAGDVIKAVVLRDKKEITIDIPLKKNMPDAALIPETRLDTPPPYLVAGGFVFRELDELYLQAWGNNWQKEIPINLRILWQLRQEAPTEEQKRLLILTDVFPDEYNMGYHDMAQNIVKSVNGIPVDSIEKMEAAFKKPTNGFHVVEFTSSYGISKVILDAKKFESATKSIMKKYQIPSRIQR